MQGAAAVTESQRGRLHRRCRLRHDAERCPPRPHSKWRSEGTRTGLGGSTTGTCIGPAPEAIGGPWLRHESLAVDGIIDFMTSKPNFGQAETIAAQLKDSGRPSMGTPLRRTFVQQGSQKKPQPGPLAEIVKSHDETALDLYLLLRTLASAEPWDVVRDARIWGRMIGHGSDVDGGAAIVSKAWRRLDEKYRLIERSRSGRLARITVLDESGDRTDYQSPATGYFKIPFDYWLAPEAWYLNLSLAAKATLLIALSLKQPFALPAERGPAWYGISADTIGRGLIELRDKGILSRSFQTVTDWNSPTGERTDYRFQLQVPFDAKAIPAKRFKASARKRTSGAPALSVVGE